MKRGFTLIEMMVVIAVLVTLMAMTFRLANIGSDTEARTMTISRMQRLENALSGFHAAFGCYPPVKLHGNRSLESQDRTINWANEGEAWRWVREVCRAQPIGCRFPFPKGAGNSITDAIKDLSDMIREASNSEEFQDLFSSQDMKDWAAAGFMSASDSKVEGRLSGKKDKVLWSDMKLFQYGVMSYLLPRYLVMMGGDRQYYESNDGSGGYAQWSKNNQEPSDPYTGDTISWSRVYDWVQNYVNSNEQMNENVMKLRMMPSQAVCARWMPNLEGACRCNRDVTLFGVHIKSSHWIDMGIFDGMSMARLVNALRGICYSPVHRPVHPRRGDRAGRLGQRVLLLLALPVPELHAVELRSGRQDVPAVDLPRQPAVEREVRLRRDRRGGPRGAVDEGRHHTPEQLTS